MKYEWKYGENEDCNYYEVNLGKDYLSVYATKNILMCGWECMRKVISILH